MRVATGGILAVVLVGAPCAAQRTEPPRAVDAAGHAFLDRRNTWLFAGVAVTRALDFHSTGDMRRRGRDEILLTNAIVDNTPLFVAIEVAGAAASVGLSRLFHGRGHHRLERWNSYVHIGITTFGAARNYLLDSARDPMDAATMQRAEGRP